MENVRHRCYSKPRVSKSRVDNHYISRYRGYVTHWNSKSMVDTYPLGIIFVFSQLGLISRCPFCIYGEQLWPKSQVLQNYLSNNTIQEGYAWYVFQTVYGWPLHQFLQVKPEPPALSWYLVDSRWFGWLLSCWISHLWHKWRCQEFGSALCLTLNFCKRESRFLANVHYQDFTMMWEYLGLSFEITKNHQTKH